MAKFVRGARVGGVLEAVQKVAAVGQSITLGEVIYVLMDVRQKYYGEISKEDLMNLVSKAWDAYGIASASIKETK